MRVIVVLGVGRIGLPIVQRFAATNAQVRAYDPRSEMRDAVETAEAIWTDDPIAALADADLLLTVLPGSPELRELMIGRRNLLAHLDSDTVWIDLTSTAPDLGQELAAAAHQRGIAYLDAPLGGGPAAAQDGALTLYVGGDRAVFDLLRPDFNTIAAPERTHYMGRHGSGYLTKLIVNGLWFTQAAITGELLLAGQHAGIGPDRLREVLLTGPARSDFLADYVPRLLAGDYLSTFGLDRIVEELDSLHRHLDAAGLRADVLSRVMQVHRRALDRLGAIDGELAVIDYLEQQAGAQLRS